ncbi:MAG: hypothetical protein DRI37_03490 [Chloroflexi bacterium]|nr:MAG: hypothetical protein DRI37_03490 [Chloroflexota bacterium]
MKQWHICTGVFLALVMLGLLGFGLHLSAAPADLEPGGLAIPLGQEQAGLRAAYHDTLAHLYSGGRVHRLAHDAVITGAGVISGPVTPGDLYLPPGEVDPTTFCPTCTSYELAGALPIPRAYALYPGRVAVLRSSATIPIGEEGEGIAMWEIAEIRQVLDGYLGHAVPYDILTETQVVDDLAGYDLLIIPTFRMDAYGDVISLLDEGGALAAIEAFVAQGGTLYAQSTGLFVAEEAGVLPANTVSPYETIHLLPPDDIVNRGRLQILNPQSPLATSWLTNELYVLNDPVLYPDEGGELEIIAELTNTTGEGPVPAVVRYPYGLGQVIGVVGHPTDPTRRNELPLFMNALLTALSGRADFYGDAVQTFNPAYDPHEFPAYERVPVSVTLHVENLWDATLGATVVTETVSPGYTVLTNTVTPAPGDILTTAGGHTLIVWQLGDLAAQAQLTLTYQAETDPEVLAAGIGTFSQGTLAYSDPDGKPVRIQHLPFVLTARMAARLVGDRDLEADRHYRIPEEGIYLDIALPLENKEETLAVSPVLTDWVYLIVPMVDYADQRVILSDNAGETVWMRNEPFLWGYEQYPQPVGAVAPTQTYTLADWQGDWCVFTSTYGIHTDPPPTVTRVLTDYGSFITIPPTYTDYISVTADHELLLPCLPLIWEVGDFPGYWYEEPAVRYGVHSSELLGREVVFHGTPIENAAVITNDAGSVYVLAGTDTVPFRENLEAATPYAAAPPTLPLLAWQDIWSRTHTMTLRAAFYDVWDWDSCSTCGGNPQEQHAGANVTFGLWADLDGDGTYETPVREIPTRLPRTQLRLLGKTYSATFGDTGQTISPTQNLIELPIFKGLGIKICPEYGDWWSSYRSLEPGHSELISVSEQIAYDHLFFQQDIPLGSSAAFVVSATIDTYDFNRERLFKLHDGPRLVYRQLHAGPNRYEVYDGHVQAAEGYSSDGAVTKWAGPTAVSVYSDTLLFDYHVWDMYDARDFGRDYDPYLKSWGYDDLVWTTYAGGREEKTLFHTTLGPADHTRVRIALDNNTGLTLTNLSVALDLPAGITATLLYTDPATAPEPIWPELAFLNRTEVPDAWRSVWYFDLEVGDVAADLWGKVLEIPVVVSADNLPSGNEAPPVRLALKRATDPTPRFISGLAHGLVLTDVLPSDVVLQAAILVTDPTVLTELQDALDVDAGMVLSDTAGELFDTLVPTRATPISFTMDGNVVTFDLPEAQRWLPSAEDWHLVTKATLIRAQHGPNVVNEGPVIRYTDPFSVSWLEQGPGAVVEAHGAAIWVEYYCEGGSAASVLPASARVTSYEGECTIPSDEPVEIVMDVTAYNAGDAIARAVTITLELPFGVTVTESTPPWAYLDAYRVTWLLGDLAPGEWREFVIIFWVEPDEGEWENNEVGFDGNFAPHIMGRILAVDHSDGEFTDDYTQQVVRGQVGGDSWFKVLFTPRTVYLPVILRNYSPSPDLVVEALPVDPGDPSAVQVHIANVGSDPASGFWVDLYLDPTSPPEVNQPWTQLCYPHGAAWYVDTLQPGESLILTVGGPFYQSEQSRWPADAYPSGDHDIWAYVDSWGDPYPWGGVQELHEDNNRWGPVAFTVTGVTSGQPLPGAFTPIPPRPRYPGGNP